ncbi:cyanidin 3-O-rutinoside 5-O-glucosyltransferase-like [Miscanthus floridulus]|uniref:cyanidin 3-O-rutinoside 5-O-glucosyltransferase-like n=1 Tax=Miscanthus floridulus TaxID=154761 RepID=UPI0034590FE5
MADEEHQQRTSHHHGHHFLVVAYGIQSHVNPARALAHRLAQLSDVVDGSILATLSVHVAAHRRMFPSSLDADQRAGEEEACSDGVISYVPHSDGFDDGSLPRTPEDWARRRRVSTDSLSAMLARFAAGGRPVTCVVCTLLVPAAVEVATRHGIPFAVYWIQPATVLAAEYHYFHGYGEVAAAHVTDPAYEVSLPGLRRRPLRIRDFPSYLVDTTGSPLAKSVVEMIRELFESMDQWRPKVLVNTFDELEATVLSEMKRHLDVFAVGPMVAAGGSSNEERTIHLYKHDDADKKRYMDWLGAQPEKSVVYVSFGSIASYTKQQMEEMVEGLLQCGRPYLLAVRRDGLEEGARRVLENTTQSSGGHGMVVDWCNQPEVLSHPAVGCFVSHCGWNSTMEAMAAAVPLVGVPSMFDQPTNAHLVEEWEIGIRGERNSEGVLAGMELARCVELVMGQGTKAMAMRERVKALKERAQQAADAGGPAERNLRDFVSSVQQVCGCVRVSDNFRPVEIAEVICGKN